MHAVVYFIVFVAAFTTSQCYSIECYECASWEGDSSDDVKKVLEQISGKDHTKRINDERCENIPALPGQTSAELKKNPYTYPALTTRVSYTNEPSQQKHYCVKETIVGPNFKATYRYAEPVYKHNRTANDPCSYREIGKAKTRVCTCEENKCNDDKPTFRVWEETVCYNCAFWEGSNADVLKFQKEMQQSGVFIKNDPSCQYNPGLHTVMAEDNRRDTCVKTIIKGSNYQIIMRYISTQVVDQTTLERISNHTEDPCYERLDHTLNVVIETCPCKGRLCNSGMTHMPMRILLAVLASTAVFMYHKV